MLCELVRRGGGHHLLVPELAHLALPELDEHSAVALAAVFIVELYHIHKRDMIPEQVIAQPADEFSVVLHYIDPVEADEVEHFRFVNVFVVGDENTYILFFSKSYHFGILRHKSPYSFKYLPEILDFYPLNETQNNAVGMFCFPEGVKIRDKFETPKCFNFVLTDEIGERTYGSAFIFVQELSISLREAFIPSYNEQNKTYYEEKAICALSRYPFYYNWCYCTFLFN